MNIAGTSSDVSSRKSGRVEDCIAFLVGAAACAKLLLTKDPTLTSQTLMQNMSTLVVGAVGKGGVIRLALLVENHEVIERRTKKVITGLLTAYMGR